MNDFTVSISKVENGYIVTVEEGGLSAGSDVKEYVAYDLYAVRRVLESEVPGVMLEIVGKEHKKPEQIKEGSPI